MAARTTTRKRTTRKSAPRRDTKANQQARKQMWAVVLFALGILIGALTFVQGARLWESLHNLLFGVLGWSVYFLSPLIIYIAVIIALDKMPSSVSAKLWQIAALIVMISGAIQIFGAGVPEEATFVEKVVSLYEGGKALTGGGIAGAVFAVPLISLFDKVGAAIIILLAIFVFAMLITGSTLVGLYRAATKPVKELEDAYATRMEEWQQRGQGKASPPVKKGRGGKGKVAPATAAAATAGSRFDIDVDISGDSSPGEGAENPDLPTPDGAPPWEEEKLPGHPVISEKTPDPALEKLLEAIGQDSPVEYVSPAEFGGGEAKPSQEPVPEAAKAHPLEVEIQEAQQNEIAGIVDQFMAQKASQDLQVVEVTGPMAGPDEPAYQEIPLPEEPAPSLPHVYQRPPVTLLSPAKGASHEDAAEELKSNAQILVHTLQSFGVQTRITNVCRGPAVTRYELQPSAGVKISKITGLSDDIALNLAAAGIRIEAPIPGKPAVGIEVPNKKISVVSIREIIDSPEFRKAKSGLSVALGRDIAGNIILADLAKMPHVLIAGATGSGKSVCINSIIVSLLYKSSPDEVKLLMVDPKVVELGVYNGAPHLLVPVVTDPKKAAGALNWAVTEMLNRYKSFAENGVRDLTGYNKLAETQEELQPMPQIVIIIDELADLMMVAPGDVEDAICRLAQMARAAGMHLVIATQRPSVDVITGVIKANIPSRVAFAVSSQVDSRTILDMGGAEKLLGRGDMLFYPVGTSKPQRVQGCFVTDQEVEKVVGFVKREEGAGYDQEIADQIASHVVAEKGRGKGESGGFEEEDDMLPQAIECVVEMGMASTSSLQRRLKLGYARAARMIDQLEQKGIVGPFEGSKPRQVLISKERWYEMKLRGDLTAGAQTTLEEPEAPLPVGTGE